MRPANCEAFNERILTFQINFNELNLGPPGGQGPPGGGPPGGGPDGQGPPGGAPAGPGPPGKS
jgi:hypothetical protein